MNKIKSRNIKILNDEEVNFLKDSFFFEIKDDLILVSSTKLNRLTAHKKTENFKLNFKLKKNYSWLISSLAVQMWESINDEYSLIEIQNIINKLIVMYQDPSRKDILNLLERKDEKIIKIN